MAPHGPTICSSTPARDGFCNCASSGWLGAQGQHIHQHQQCQHPPEIQSAWRAPHPSVSAPARSTLAPSMPINTNTVTSIMWRTCSTTLPICGLPRPQITHGVKISALNATAAITMNTNSGTIFATVVIWLINAASLIPRITRKCTAHSNSDAQPIASGVLPWPNAGKSSRAC